jgi:tRNA threonylcarbamoyladenosine biosynthesis protein TsaB
MLLLSTDTSGRQGSIALARGDSANCEVIEVVPLGGGTFSAQLVPQIAALLAAHGFSKKDVDAFAVASGPGSFTGLRVGLAAIKALGEILQKPIAAVSLLEAVALAGGLQGKVAAVLDAGRGDVYLGEYEISSDSAQLLGERLLTKAEFLHTAPGVEVVTSDAVLAEAARTAGISVSTIDPINAGFIAQLGVKKVLAGITISPEQLEANYIRRTDAEILAKIGS